MITLLDKTYDGESICDAERDVYEAFIEDFTPAVSGIPSDDLGFQTGTFKVTVTWEPDDERT
jgi:hypothetical protein